MLKSTDVQNLGFALLIPYIFFVFSRFSEFIDPNGNARFVMILALFAGLATLLTGGVFRALASCPGFWLSAFTIWLILALPFSTWRRGSLAGLTDIWLKSFATFLITGGLVITYSHCRKVVFTLAVSTALIVIAALRGGLESTIDSRLAMSYGTLGNSNDLAGQLMMGLPFCLFVLLEKKRSVLLRFVFLVISALLVVVVFKTGSRGGLLTIICVAGLFFWNLSSANRLKFAAVLLCVVAATPALVPPDVRERYMTLLSGRHPNAQVSMKILSAVESEEARRMLLRYAIELTVRNPTFGVGLEQFPNAAWELSLSKNQPGAWHPVHNIFALIASETGIPALIFYTVALIVCFKLLFSIRRAARSKPDLEHLSSMAFCLAMSLTSFTLCGMFNTNAYSVHFPILAGLITAFTYGARKEIAMEQLQSTRHASGVGSFAARPACNTRDPAGRRSRESPTTHNPRAPHRT